MSKQKQALARDEMLRWANGESPEFLVPNTSGKRAVHYWVAGRDTGCRLASTGGLSKSKYHIAADPGDRAICGICQQFAAEYLSSSPEQKVARQCAGIARARSFHWHMDAAAWGDDLA